MSASHKTGNETPERGQALFLERVRQHSTPLTYARQSMEEAARFRLANGVTDLLTKAIGRGLRQDNARHLFWPSPKTWIEGRLGQMNANPWHAEFGLLFVGDYSTSIFYGRMILFKQVTEHISQRDLVYQEYDLNFERPDFIRETERGRAMARSYRLANGVDESRASEYCTEYAADITVATLSLLCTPRTYSLRHINFDRLNVRRARKGKWPLLAYDEVRIAIAGTPPTVTPATGRGAPRPLHFVRAFPRIRLGRFEIVRPHWRGDAQLGVKRPAYVITP